MAMVGQIEMRTALIPRSSTRQLKKVTPRSNHAVRSLTGILPDAEVSDCEEGALPEDLKEYARSCTGLLRNIKAAHLALRAVKLTNCPQRSPG
jgi:Mg-chelatase subunit ChlI